MIGVLMGLSAAFSFAWSGIFTRLGTQRIGSRSGAAISMLPAAPLAMIPALIFDLNGFVGISVVGFLWIALVALLNYPIGRILNIASVSRIGAARGNTLFSSAPIWGAILAIIFLGERPNPAIIAGTVLVVLGIALVVGEAGVSQSSSNKNQ